MASGDRYHEIRVGSAEEAWAQTLALAATGLAFSVTITGRSSGAECTFSCPGRRAGKSTLADDVIRFREGVQGQVHRPEEPRAQGRRVARIIPVAPAGFDRLRSIHSFLLAGEPARGGTAS